MLSSRISKIVYRLLPPVLAVLLYGQMLSLPYFWDEVTVFEYMEGRSLFIMFTDATGFPFYRPLTFVIWRAAEYLVGLNNVFALHVINLTALIILAWLVGWLAGRIAARDSNLIACLAAGLAVLFPLHDQAVAAVNNLFHFVAVILAVGGAISLIEFEISRKWFWAASAIVLATLSPFGHESGISSGLVAVVCLVAYLYFRAENFRDLNRRRVWLVALATLAADIIYVILWVVVPKSRNPADPAWAGFESIPLNLNYFFEGLTYPTQFLAPYLVPFGIEDVWAVFLLGGLALGLAYAISRDWRWLAFGLAYGLVAAGPAAGKLVYPYLLASPRLMTYPSPAASIMWAAVAVGAAELLTRRARANAGNAPNRFGKPIAAVLIAALISVFPVKHILSQVHLHHQATDHVWAIVADTQAHPDDSLLVVNPVDWLAPVKQTYSLGNAGVVVVPAYTNVRRLVWTHTGIRYPIQDVRFPLIFPALNDFYFSVSGETLEWNGMAQAVRDVDRVAVIYYTDSEVTYRYVGSVRPTDSQTGKPWATFDDKIRLRDVRADVQAGAVDLAMVWESQSGLNADIFTNIVGCDGEEAGLSSGASLGGVYPVWLWQAGETIYDVRHISLEHESPDGCYRLLAGLFDPATGARLAALDSNGGRLENDVFTFEFHSP